jgi:hypothetical protein
MKALGRLQQSLKNWLCTRSNATLTEPERYTRLLMHLGAQMKGQRDNIVYFDFHWQGLPYQASIQHQPDGQARLEILGKVVIYQEVLEAMNNFLDMLQATQRSHFQYRLYKNGEGYRHFTVSVLPPDTVNKAMFARLLPEMAVNVAAINDHAMELYRMVLKADAEARKESS